MATGGMGSEVRDGRLEEAPLRRGREAEPPRVLGPMEFKIEGGMNSTEWKTLGVREAQNRSNEG